MSSKILTYDEILQELRANTDAAFADFMRKLIVTNARILGVRTPVLRALAKAEYANYPFDMTVYEQVALRSFSLGKVKDVQEMSRLTEAFVPVIDNWAVCDQFVSSQKGFKKCPEGALALAEKYAAASGEFERRYAIVLCMSYLITDDYVDRATELVAAAVDDRYYVQMAAAWFCATAAVNYTDKAKTLFDGFPDTVKKMTRQKMRDSFRVFTTF